MATRTIQLRGHHKELHHFYKELLSHAKFVIMHEERADDGFRIIAVNKKRMSQLTYNLLSLIGGFVPKNRLGIELFAVERSGVLTIELMSEPYIWALDMEAAVESQEDRDKCRELVDLFANKMLEGFQSLDRRL